MNWHQFTRFVTKYGRKAAPIMLVGAGTALSLDAIRKTYEVAEYSKELEDSEACELGRDLTYVEKIKTCWPAWVPVIWREGASLVCFYFAFGLKDHRAAAAAAMAAYLEREKDNLDDSIREYLGEERYEEFYKKTMDKGIERALAGKEGRELSVGPDESLGVYYEPLTGKIFKNDPRNLDRVISEINEEYHINGYVSLSKFFTKLKINPPEVSNYIGWSYNPGYGDIKYKTYEYYWSDKNLYITGLDLGIKLDEFVRTWY